MPGGGPRYEPQARVPAPESLILEVRKERVDEVVAGRTRNLVVVLDRLEDHFNMGAVLRTCDALGIQEIHVVENPAEKFEPNAAVTQGCDKWMDVTRYPDFASVRAALKGYRVLASAVKADATPLDQLSFDGKVAIVFGNERYGVSQDVLDHVDGTFWIPMRGFSRSLNISAAAAATLWHAVSWRKSHLGVAGDLTEVESAALKERFYKLSVKQRRRLYK